MTRLAIIGAGAWGTALALVARRAGGDVAMWARSAAIAAAISEDHENSLYLPGVALDPSISATTFSTERTRYLWPPTVCGHRQKVQRDLQPRPV